MGEATASIALVWPFLSEAERAGRGDVSDRVRGFLGLSASELSDPSTRVPVAALIRLLEATLRVRGERDVGLLAAQRVDQMHFGLLEDVARNRTTLHGALEAGRRYVALLGEGVHYSFEIAGERAFSRLWFDPVLDVSDVAVEFVVALGLLWARRVSGDAKLSPREVHFMHAPPKDTSQHEALFACRVVFGAPATQVVMAAPALQRALGSASSVLSGLYEQRAQHELRALPGASGAVALQVRRLLVAQQDLSHVNVELVARRLGMGARTLARRLQAERMSYREVLDTVRRQVAQRELSQGNRTLAEIARRLGFASPQAFNRAFRRWTGTSAASWRRDRRPPPH